MPHAHHAVFESILVSATLIAAGVAYVCGSLRLRRLEFWQTGSFLLGLFFIWLAVASPQATLDHQLLTGHMVQHLLLMSLAAPLLWLGAPIEPLQRGLPRRFMEVAVTPLAASALTRRVLKAMTHPAVCWLAATVTLIGWHIPAAFALGMQSETWHVIEQASFLAAGLLFWWPVIRPWRNRSRSSEWSIILYLFLATLPCDILSGFLVFYDRLVYPGCSSSSRLFGLSALEDQQCAGALMWTVVTVVFLLAGTIFTARLLSPLRSREHVLLPSSPYGGRVSQAVRQSTEAL
jgi:putative membrane protein